MTGTSTIDVGDPVIVRFGPRRVVATVTEDRGQLGPHGERIFRIRWSPGDTDEPAEAEVLESSLVRANPNLEYARALARIDEWSFIAASNTGPGLEGVAAAQVYVDDAIAAVRSRGTPRDYELLHRTCVESLGPGALRARRSWTDVNPAQDDVMPTLNRLPAMIQAADTSTDRFEVPNDVSHWYELVTSVTGDLSSRDLADKGTGDLLLRLIGYCAGMASWIRMTYNVGD